MAGVPTNTLSAASIIRSKSAVMDILPIAGLSEIIPFEVTAIGISMINKLYRVLTCHHFPDNSMCVIVCFSNMKDQIALNLMRGSLANSRFYPIDAPANYAGVRFVAEQLQQILLRWEEPQI
jgi:hypothetical protein